MRHKTDRRFEVFIGSPFCELKKVRDALRDAILWAGHFPCGTELWVAKPDPTLDGILSYLDNCDIHILILGATYGSLIPKDQLAIRNEGVCSFTEWEYDESTKALRPVIAFLLNETEVKERRANAKAGRVEGEALEAEKAYDKFRKKLEEARIVRYFSMKNGGVSTLERDCNLALQEFLHGRSSVKLLERGYIRANSNEGRNLLAIRESPMLQDVIERISKFDVLARRMNEQPNAKRTMARCFWFQMQRRVRDWCQVNSRDQKLALEKRPMQIFFESGSTIVYLSKGFEQYILGRAGIHENWHIRTNNILCLLQFDLFTCNNARSFPDGKPDPEDKYGAIFPAEWGVLERPPHRDPAPVCNSENRAIRIALKSLNDEGKPCSFIFAAASGWDVEGVPEDFRGPHVGSYKNKLFKRVLLESGNPIVIFIDAIKFGSPRGPGCYTVFGPQAPLTKWLRMRPIALCVGWEGANGPVAESTVEAARFSGTANGEKPKAEDIPRHLRWVRKQAESLGFDVEYFCQEEQDSGGLWSGAFLIGNNCFSKTVPV